MTQMISTFDFGGKSIRVLGTAQDPLFVAKDIVEGVGAVWASTSLDHIPEDFKGVRSVLTPSGTQSMRVLTEAGLNMYLFRSDKPAALPFQRKLAEEVLPSIRKTGMYATDALLDDPDLLLKTVTKLSEERKMRLAAEQEAQRATEAKLLAQAEVVAVTEAKAAVESRHLSLSAKVRSLMDSHSDGILIRDAAKYFRAQGHSTCTETKLRATLQGIGALTKGYKATATTKALSAGILTVKGGSILNHKTGWEGEATTPRVTGKGMAWLSARLEALGYPADPEPTVSLDLDLD